MTAARPQRLLVTGARGQLAGAIAEAYASHAEVIAYTRQELDITDPVAVIQRVRDCRPDLIVNCAAYNAVDDAEDNAPEALNVNAFAVRSLTRAAVDVGATFVHYSTDFVFDGRTDRPYTEEDRPNPESVYAQSKLLGEWFAAEHPRGFVLRVESLFGGAAAKSSIDRIAAAVTHGRPAKVFVDRIVSPSYVVDVASATRALVERGEPGLYHCVGTGHATWFELAKEIARVLGKESEATLEPVRVAEVALKAPRPQFAALANDKIRRVIEMPTWQDALRRYLA